MNCVTVKSNIVEINSKVLKLRIGIRDPLACDCGPIVRDTAIVSPRPAYTLTITRKGKTTALVAYVASLNDAGDGYSDFFLDSALAALPRGLYTGTITRSLGGEVVPVDPVLTFWIKPPHRHDGVYTMFAGATNTDENPS